MQMSRRKLFKKNMSLDIFYKKHFVNNTHKSQNGIII